MTLLSIIRPTEAQTGTGLVDDNFNAETLSAPPSNWTVEAGALWQVLAAPGGWGNLEGRVLVAFPDTVIDGYIRKNFTRQVDGELRIQVDWRTPNATPSAARGGILIIYDTTGNYVAQLGAVNGAWIFGNSTGDDRSVGSWVAGGFYEVVFMLDLDQKKYKFSINNVTYDNGGLLYPMSTGTTGIDRFKISAYSPSTAAFDFDNVRVGRLEPTLPPPTATGTLSTSGVFDGVTLGADRFGRVLLGYANSDTLIARMLVERSTDNATWADISAVTQTTQTGTGRWVVTDRRPHYGAQATTYGGTVYYRVSGANSGGATPASSSGALVADVDKTAYETARFAVVSSLMGGSAIPSRSDGEAYPTYPMMASAYAFLRTNNNQYLTDASTQFTYVQSLTTAQNVIAFPDYPLGIYRDFHWRTILHTAACAQLLRRHPSAQTLAASMISQADTWAQGFYDNMNSGVPTTSVTRAGWDPDNLSTANAVVARAASTSYALGAIVRPVATNGRSYRATAITTGITAAGTPTWPTTNGGTVVDGGVTWTETTVTGGITWSSYDTTTPYAGQIGTDVVDLNQNTEEVAALALLLTDPLSALFNAGALRTEALTHITDTSNIISTYDTTTGAIPLGDTYPANNGPEGYDTLYGSYVTELLAVAVYYAPALVNQWLTTMLSKALTWLDTSYGTEPLTTMRFSGDIVLHGPELTFREVPHIVKNITNPVRNIRYTAALNVPSAERYADYEVNGLTTATIEAWQARAFTSDVFVELLQPQRDAVVMAPMLTA